MNDYTHLKSGKYFCIAPWVHLHMWPNGNTYSCCMSEIKDQYVLGNVREQTIPEIIESSGMQKLRQSMLRNEHNDGCVKCYEIEDNGVNSLRNNLNYWYFDSSVDLLDDPTAFKYKYVDIRISNICNLKCRSCGPDLSSKWYDDLDDWQKKETTRIQKIFKKFDDFYDVLNDYIYDIEEIYFAGGEPLIMEEHWLLIAKLKELGLKPKLFYQTNLTNLNYKKHSAIDLWSSFPDIRISASIDAVGEHSRFVRHGTKWDEVEQNIRLINDQLPHVQLFVTMTTGLLNLFQFIDTHEYFLADSLIRPGFVWVNPVLNPVHYAPTSIPAELKPELTKKLLDYCDDLEERYKVVPIGNITYTTNGIRMIVKLMNSKDTFEDIKESLSEITLKLDKKRDENWEDYLPELIPFLGA